MIEVVNRYHLFFIYENVGTDLLSDPEKDVLRNMGIDIDLFERQPNYIEYAFRFGLLAEALGDERTKDMNFYQLKKFISSGKFIPLNQTELNALQIIKRQAYHDIKGLGNRISTDMQTTIIEADRKLRSQYEKTIEEQATIAVTERESVKQLVSRIGHKTEDWSRDFIRISDYIMHDAYDNGRAMSIMKTYGEKALVYKLPKFQACESCVALYMIGDTPRIFELQTLMSNGSNIGVPKKEWKAVISPVHPHCRCVLNRVPLGYKWNVETKMFDIPIQVPPKKERTGKIGIAINGGEMKYR